ncbi:DNA polymerase III subunit gamma/tau [Hymenobacter sp. BT175]|uniref:DNA polymerase III subunit gamma/tau n=1 Tax=Hymenobacter translucens TaxID=2886507 RepID=UPI001D0EEBFB|nr:DNA polymerase III subunit gamma/tau [Hymenobacter translucens]MCC2547640.1 DNA polymerase III subunit gamma/tau [Hymenobacter translucens]
MENFVVSARKYRPVTFKSVVGQQHVTTTLQNAIVSQHLAQAFLFCGPRGVGKTTCARILAKTINCEFVEQHVRQGKSIAELTAAGLIDIIPEKFRASTGPGSAIPAGELEACGNCPSCRAFQENASFNVHELDAASNNSVEDIRSLVEQVRYAPQQGRFKVYIIDEVHMLSNAAFNAFLKTLEEPPSYAIFILATTERHKIIPTILSRCQIFDFNRIRVEDMRLHLRYVATQEQIKAEDDALHLLAQKADGGLRDALSMFDQMVTFSGQNLTYKDVVQNLHVLDYEYYFRLVEALLTENLSAALLLLDEVMQNGFDLHNFVVGAAEHLRGLLVCKDPVTVQLLEVSDGIRNRYVQQAQAAPLAFLLSALNLVSACDREFKQAKNQRLHVELTLMKLAYLNGAVQFARELAPAAGQRASSDNGEAKKKTNVSAPASAPVAAPAPVSPPASAAAAPPAPAVPVVTAPPAGEELVPVESGVEELHPTPSIEDEEADVPVAEHQMLDTFPHVEVGMPSVAGHGPGHDVQTAPAPPRPLPPLARPGAIPSKLPSLSLRDIQAQVAEQATRKPVAAAVVEKAVDEPVGVLVPLDMARLEQVWNELKEERRQDRMSEYTVLNREFTADEQHIIRLTVDNPIQLDQFNEFRQDFLTELRRRTGYPRLNVQLTVNEQVSTARKLYTSSDKFEYLAEKFPALLEMKQRLGLDVD